MEESGEHNFKYEHNLRKITFFLILNTDATFKYNLNDDNGISHVLGTCPLISKFLLVSLIWGLQLNRYFYECLKFTPIWFAFQFVETAISSIKHLEPYEVLEIVENLVKAIYESIIRSDIRILDIIDKKIILTKFYDFTTDLLRQFYTPDAIKHLLDAILFCFDGFENPISPKLDKPLKIYEICSEMCPINTTELKEHSDLVKQHLQSIISSLLNSLQYNVMFVTVDVFMHWVEVDISEDLTLQAVIGTKAYNVLERMSTNSSFGHDVEQQLKFIAIRPKTIQETVKAATMGEILRTLDDFSGEYHVKKVWLDELLNRPIAFDNDECIDTIRADTKLFSVENCYKILDYVKLQLETEVDGMSNEASLEEVTSMFDGIIEVLLKALNNFKCDQLQEIIVYKLKLFGMKSTIFMQSDHIERLTELFNKLTDRFDTSTFLCLCFENAEISWEKFFNESCTSQELARNFCETFINYRKIGKNYFPTLLESSFPDKCNEKLYPNFLFEIYQSEILEKEVFFKTFVCKNIAEMLEIENYEALLCMLKALHMIAHKNSPMPNFGAVTAPILIIAAQIMEQCRWDLVTYSDIKDEILRMTIDFIQMVSNKFLPVATEEDKKWITGKVKSYRPLTKYYFQKFSLRVDEQPKIFDRFLHLEDFNDESEAEKFLMTTFVRCTCKESEWLAKSDRLLPHFSDMILILEGVVTENRDDLKNFRNCISNYANIVRKHLIPSIVNDPQKVSDLGFNILQIISSTPKNLYDEIFINFQGILLEVFQH